LSDDQRQRLQLQLVLADAGEDRRLLAFGGRESETSPLRRQGREGPAHLAFSAEWDYEARGVIYEMDRPTAEVIASF
jgi:hypothetical protein